MSHQGMHPEDIKAAIRKRGVTLTELSVSLGYSEATVRNALIKPMPSVEPLIAKFIGKTLHEIWPDRWDKENIRIRPKTNRRKSKQSKTVRHCKK
ncbi:MAG: hypothetical protein CBB87_08220 [Micavibrio sp. TMED27]|nr:hypothetical protein [Micavibrio sp.]OUT90839.1 MAG: hypothetical protein CBB87_08220 [Micavibrio sp. TMED27]